jgi:pimeloyl-ACP methyl ester carboxylesterase
MASNRRLLDIVTLMDALKIEKAIIAGFDWGARTADIMAALWPASRQLGQSTFSSLTTFLQGNAATRLSPSVGI